MLIILPMDTGEMAVPHISTAVILDTFSLSHINFIDTLHGIWRSRGKNSHCAAVPRHPFKRPVPQDLAGVHPRYPNRRPSAASSPLQVKRDETRASPKGGSTKTERRG